MQLTPEQVEYLLELIRRVTESDSGDGEVRVEIKNGHVRRAWATIQAVFPAPDKAPQD